MYLRDEERMFHGAFDSPDLAQKTADKFADGWVVLLEQQKGCCVFSAPNGSVFYFTMHPEKFSDQNRRVSGTFDVDFLEVESIDFVPLVDFFSFIN